ncbi:hypothetical protein [Granulicella sibirica]|uniref:Putative Bacterial Ig-like domain (Group 1) n=1 Tax=Granulicella sibirica TaxID=2479048 RepID=A0A4Q0SXQ1_9BACT|nr:hypothetical protein [Granulicella sibirica]RXH55935.1 putative Bacterial Ig-like domain (group 1) [Granulicella sibirica]
MTLRESTRQATQAASRLLGRLIAAALIVLLLPLPRLHAQEPANIKTSAPLTLHINILEGEGALNNIRQRTAREPIVQVEDQNHKPVAGVTVLFSSIDGPSGASGTFNAARTFQTVTDAEGKAVGHGFTPNATTGQFNIEVQATAGSVSTSVVIHQINSLTSTSGAASAAGVTTAASTKGVIHLFHIVPKWVVVGVAAGTATAVAVAVTVVQNPSGATISSGGGTVTAPASRPTTTARR